MDPEELQVSGWKRASLRGSREGASVLEAPSLSSRAACLIIGNTKVKRNRPLSFSPALRVMDAIQTKRGMAEMCVQPGRGEGPKGGERTMRNQRRDQGGDGPHKPSADGRM